MVLVGGIVRVDFTPMHVRGRGRRGRRERGRGGREKRDGECMQPFHFIIHFT